MFCFFLFSTSSFPYIFFFGCSMFGFFSYIWKRTGDTNILAITPLPWGEIENFSFFKFFSNLVNLSLQVKDCRIFHWWKWKIGQPKTQGDVLFKEGHSEVLPKGLHRRAQTLQRQQWIRCTFINYLQFLIDVFFLLLFSIP